MAEKVRSCYVYMMINGAEFLASDAEVKQQA